MNNINTYFRCKDIPVNIGEFGVMSRNNDYDRERWAEIFVGSATELGVSCVLLDNGVFEGDGERFGIINRTQLTITYPKYLKGLMAGISKTIDIDIPDVPVETPIVEIPIAEIPIVESPVAESPVAESPIAENLIAENSIVQKPIVKVPLIKKPIAKKPIFRKPNNIFIRRN